MKRSCIILCLLVFSALFACAQSQITRSELLKLYYEANVAANNNNDSVAIERFLTIIKHVPSMSDPYLRIAEIYDKPNANRQDVESAIFMYRNFVDIELDEDKSKQARERLCELEKSLDIPLFVEYSEKNEYQPENVESIPASDEDIKELLADEDDVAQSTVFDLDLSSSDKKEVTFDLDLSSADKNEQVFDLDLSSSDKKEVTFDLDLSSADKNKQVYDLDLSSSDKKEVTFDLDLSSADKNEQVFDLDLSSSDKKEVTFDLDLSSADKNKQVYDLDLSSSDKKEVTVDLDLSSADKNKQVYDLDLSSSDKKAVAVDVDLSSVLDTKADEAVSGLSSVAAVNAGNAIKEVADAKIPVVTESKEVKSDKSAMSSFDNSNIPFFNVEKSRFGELHTFVNRCNDIEIVTANTYKKSIEKKPISIDALCGRWVSASKLYNGREMWIIDISYSQNVLKASLNRTSGVNQMASNKDAFLLNSEQFNSYYNYFQIHNNLDGCRGNDISPQTMQLIKNIKDYSVNVELKNDALSFEFVIDKSYKPNADGYEMSRSGVGKCSEMLTIFTGANPLISFFSSLVSSGISVAEKYDKPYDVEGNISFTLSMTERGLVGTCKEIVAHISNDGIRKEKSNNTVECSFYKVPDSYYGASISESVKTELQEKKEEEIFDEIKENYKNDKAKRYFLDGVAKSYNLGKPESGRWNPVAGLKSFIKAADEGDAVSLKIVTATYYALSRNTEYSNSKRRKYLSLAQKYGEKLYLLSPAEYNNVLASHYVACDVLSGYPKAVSLYKEAIERYNNDEARCNLAQLYMMDGDAAERNMALKELTNAVENGYSPAIVNLANYYKEQNAVESYIALIDMALKKNDYNALPLLSLAYMQGIGVNQNYVESVGIYDEYLTILNNEWRTILGNYVNIE